MKIKKLLAFSILLMFLFTCLVFPKTIVFGKIEAFEYHYELLNNKEKQLYNELKVFRKDFLFEKGSSIDIYKNGIITDIDLFNYINGSDDLYKWLYNATNAFFLDYPDQFFVDRFKVGYEIFEDEDKEYHVLLGSGRLDSALKEEFLNSTVLKNSKVVFEEEVNALYKLFYGLDYDNVIELLKTLTNSNDVVKVALDKVGINSYLEYEKESLHLYVANAENKFDKVSSKNTYSYGQYYFDYIPNDNPACLMAIDSLPNGFYLESKKINEFKYEFASNYSINAWVLLPYPDGYNVSQNNDFSLLVDGKSIETYKLSLGLLANFSVNSSVEISVQEQSEKKERTLVVIDSFNVDSNKSVLKCEEESNIAFNIEFFDSFILDTVIVDGRVVAFSDSTKANVVVNYEDLKEYSIAFIVSTLKEHKHENLREKYANDLVDEYGNKVPFELSAYIEGTHFALENDLVILNCIVSGPGTYYYEWYVDGVLIENVNEQILVISMMDSRYNGKYTVKVTSVTTNASRTIETESFSLRMTETNDSYNLLFIILLGLVILGIFVVVYIYDCLIEKQREGIHR